MVAAWLLKLVPFKWLFAAAAVLALIAGLYFGYEHLANSLRAEGAAPYIDAIDKQKAEAAATLASETDKVHAAERALQDFKNNQELQDADHKKTVADLSDRLRRIAGAAGRLRDPNAAGCGQGSGGATNQTATTAGGGPANPAQAGGLLSAELSGLLAQLTKEADDINIAYTSCRADAYAVRGISQP